MNSSMGIDSRKSLTASPWGAIVFSILTSFYYWVLTYESWYILAIGGILQCIGLYLLASQTQRTSWGEFWRGGLIGTNASFNAIFWYALTDQVWMSIGLGTVLFLSSILAISRSKMFHPWLGWLNWLLPMSWPVNVLGLLMFVINLVFAPIGYLHPILKGIRIRLYVDIKTCTFTQYGGLIRPIKGFSGLNMGNFIFINPGWEHLLKHEIGHLFSLAAMGFVFHYFGGIDENYFQKRYWEAYAEYIAESYNKPEASGLSMWQ